MCNCCEWPSPVWQEPKLSGACSRHLQHKRLDGIVMKKHSMVSRGRVRARGRRQQSNVCVWERMVVWYLHCNMNFVSDSIPAMHAKCTTSLYHPQTPIVRKKKAIDSSCSRVKRRLRLWGCVREAHFCPNLERARARGWHFCCTCASKTCTSAYTYIPLRYTTTPARVQINKCVISKTQAQVRAHQQTGTNKNP